jgi:anti-anti-sigma regulatory factor
MSTTWNEFDLADRPPLGADDPLLAFLREKRGEPVRILFGRQRRIDTRLIQVLLSAARDWRARGVGFEIAQVPSALAEDFGRIGLEPGMLDWRAGE